MDKTCFETTIILDEERIKECPYQKEEIYYLMERIFSTAGMKKEGIPLKKGPWHSLVGP